jgi:hypothetical protein
MLLKRWMQSVILARRPKAYMSMHYGDDKEHWRSADKDRLHGHV